MTHRLWWLIDYALHALRIKSNWVCDRYDLALGVKADELRMRPDDESLDEVVHDFKRGD